MTPNWKPDPPDIFASAKERFSEFLAKDDWPPRICWLRREDILVGCRDFRFLVHPQQEVGQREAEKMYSLGLERGLGIALVAMCASNDETYAYVMIPRMKSTANTNS